MRQHVISWAHPVDGKDDQAIDTMFSGVFATARKSAERRGMILADQPLKVTKSFSVIDGKLFVGFRALVACLGCASHARRAA